MWGDAVCLRWSRARHARALWMQMLCLWHFSKLPCQIVVSPPSDKIRGILVLVWKSLKHTGILWYLAVLPVKHESTRKCMNLDVLIVSYLHNYIIWLVSLLWLISCQNVYHRRSIVHSGRLCSHALSGRDAGTWSSSFPLPSNKRCPWGICKNIASNGQETSPGRSLYQVSMLHPH